MLETYVVLPSQKISSRSKAFIENLLSDLVSLPTHPHRILPQLRPKRFLYHQNRLKRLYINVREEPLKPPSDSLAGHPKRLVNLLAICPL